MLIGMLNEEIWPCIKDTLEYLSKKRTERVSDSVKAGLNFSIILGSACYLEGVFEALLRAILTCRRVEFNRVHAKELDSERAVNLYFNRLEEDTSERISKSTGAAAYDEMFELLFGEPMSSLIKVEPLWEGVTILFNFRNVLGHGRRVFARKFEGLSIPGGFREDFRGSYRAVESYLLKKRLTNKRFIDAHLDYGFLSDAIADHFSCLAKQIPSAISASLPRVEQAACVRVLAGAGQTSETPRSVSTTLRHVSRESSVDFSLSRLLLAG
jgi:hypothetical protein